MIIITTRSSRLFVVLLHLLGVSTHFPSSWIESGIVGVNPQSIVLENSDPLHLGADDRSYLQPHWLQDTFDQSCLGPMGGFSECGDATLWLVLPRQRLHARRRQWIRWAMEQDESYDDFKPQGYALQMMDNNNNYIYNKAQNEPSSESLSEYSWDEFSEKDCLTRRRKDNRLYLVPCSQERAWSWHFNENGILYFEKQKNNRKLTTSSTTTNTKRLLNKQRTLECVGRNATDAVIVNCNGETSPIELASDMDERVVQIALVRQATAVPSNSSSKIVHEEYDIMRIPEEENQDNDEHGLANEETVNNIPSHVDIAHIHASGPAIHAELLAASSSSSSSRRTSLSPHNRESEAPKLQDRPPLQFLQDANPILIATADKNKVGKMSKVKPSLHAADINAQQIVRKIQVHPYIEASKDDLWTDPRTGLVFRTDLSKYLGHDRKEVGRHTLTGVGQYMKTAFNIKVYGVALYVSKRDVLADPAMAPFASKSSEELRQSKDFYAVLRHMVSSGQPNGGRFDRTLFIKTNMQLTVETMQNSLKADWKLLTDEAKSTLVGSSMRSRPANEAMMEVIKSPDNPSRCSCAQTAPEEYNADLSCCARGTELVFTWRKDGQLEIRLNEALMDSFHRPDIAAGIFYEYLRLDDPMSTDFIDRVVDGFPFLLAPLYQVKGVTSSILMQQGPSSAKKGSQGNHRLAKAFGDLSEALTSRASNFADFVQYSAGEVTNGAVNTVRSVGDAARNLGGEMERRRDLIGKHVSGFASSFYGRSRKSLAPVLPKWIENMTHLHIPESDEQESNEHRGSFFARSFSQFFKNEASPSALDEIIPMIHPSTNSTQRFFFGVVHLYLLLLLIVSFPAQLTTRTKLVVVRKTAQALSDSENSDSEGSIDSTSQNCSLS